MSAAPSLDIRTPEGIEFRLPLAGPIARMLAYAVDLLVIAVIGTLIDKAVAPLLLFGPDAAQAIQVILYFVLLLCYGMVLEWIWRGQTVGKRLFHLRVVDARGLRLQPSQIIVRNLLRFADALPALYLAGGIVCAMTPRRQRLGDLAAGTVVIRSREPARPDLDQITGGKYNSLAEYRHLAARLRQKVTPEMARLSLESLLRRDQLEPASRLAVFAELAAYFRNLVPYPPEAVEQLADEQYVRNVVEVLYRPY